MQAVNDIYTEIDRIYPVCHDQTKAITHLKKSRGLFSKRLKSMRHAHHEGSRLVEGPLAILAEALYRIYTGVRDALSRLHKFLFPRRDIIFGTRTDGRIVGHMTFASREDRLIPLHHMRLELWGRTRWFAWRKFGRGFTEEDGTFAIPFDMVAVHRLRIRNRMRFEIHHTG